MAKYIVGLFVVISLLTTSLGWSSTKKTPIKVGVISAATGIRAGAGLPERECAVWAAEGINKAGGILGRPIELVIEDDEGNPILSTELAKKVIGVDKVVAVCGGTSIASNIAVSKVANEYKIPHMMFMHADYVLQPGKDWRYSYSPWMVEKDLHLANANFMIKDLGWKKITLVADTTKLGEGFQKATGKALEPAGVKVFYEKYQVKETEFTPLLIRIKGQAPDGVLIAAGTYPAPARMLTTRKRMGLDIPFAITATVPAVELMKTAGVEATEGVYLLGSWLVHDPAYQSPEEKALYKLVAERKPGVGCDYFYATGWDVIHLLAKAIEIAGSTDADKITEGLASIKDYHGALGVHSYGLEMTWKDHTSLFGQRPHMLQIRGGKQTLVKY